MFFSAVPAGAVPSSKVEQARQVKAEIDKLDERIELASERHNEAKIEHNKLLKQKREAESKIKAAQDRTDVLRDHLSTRMATMYRTGQMGFLEVLLGAGTYQEFAATWDFLADLNEGDAEAVAELKRLKAELEAAQKTLAEKESAAKKQVAIMSANERSIRAQSTERKRKLAGLEAEIRELEAAEERARAAAAARQARATAARGAAPSKVFPPPTRAARSEVVNIAKRYLGAPYRWGAGGPNSFDCSGFTSFVYRQVGVSLPHSSRAQIGYGERISRADLQPGDLVFFGSPIRHVGIYVGGNQYIHSPRTGDVVKISSMGRSDYAGACRP